MFLKKIIPIFSNLRYDCDTYIKLGRSRGGGADFPKIPKFSQIIISENI